MTIDDIEKEGASLRVQIRIVESNILRALEELDRKIAIACGVLLE